jgi:hypothetical protein
MLVLSTACGGGASSSPPPAEGAATATRLDTRYLLAAPSLPPGGDLIPPEFERCRAALERATADYDAGAYPRAADGFVRAAALLAIAPGRPYADVARLARAVIYEDAAYAWRMAGERGAGIARLDRLRRSGVASDEDLGRARAALVLEPDRRVQEPLRR